MSSKTLLSLRYVRIRFCEFLLQSTPSLTDAIDLRKSEEERGLSLGKADTGGKATDVLYQ